jgi:hypothetical protein
MTDKKKNSNSSVTNDINFFLKLNNIYHLQIKTTTLLTSFIISNYNNYQ